MADTRTLPHVRQALVDQGGTGTQPWLAWFQRINDAVTSGAIGTEAADASIAAIATALGATDGTVATIPSLDFSNTLSGDTLALGLRSVQHYGSLASGQVSFDLVGDVDEPGLSYVYGTDASGVRGWRELADTDNVPEGGNLYFTDARARAAVVIDSIADADTTHAPSRNAVFDGLALKFDSAGGIVSGIIQHRSLYEFYSSTGAIFYGGLGAVGGSTFAIYGNANTIVIRPTDRATPSGVTLNTVLFAPEVTNTIDLGAATLAWKNVRIAGAYYVGTNQVLGARSTGWAAMTGTASKATIAAAAAGTASATYVQAEAQATRNRVAALEARLKALDDTLFTHGTIGT